jgi:hypothetical protein
MGILFWRGRVSKAEFRRQYIEAVRARMPECECRESPDEELAVLIQGLPNHGEIIHRLVNAYAEFRKDPRERDGIFERWLDSLTELAQPLTVTRTNILPLVKDRTWLSNAYDPVGVPAVGSAQALIHEALNDDLFVVYMVMGASFQFLKREDLASAGIPEQEVRSLALANMRARINPPAFVDAPVGWLLNVGGNFEATQLIDDDVWNDPRFSGAETLLVAVPDRNSILASIDVSVSGVWALAAMASSLARSESYPITNKLFVRRGMSFEPLDPPIVDLDHPIPRLDVLDVYKTSDRGGPHAGIVIASPLGGEPRSVFRLFRKLEMYLNELGCSEDSRKPPVEEILRPHIWVRIHPGSDPDVLELLGSLDGLIADRGAVLKLSVTE